jgi:hypothetical protein
MRIQSSHCHDARGLDAYFSPPEATESLLAIEHGKLPRRLWEPAAGDGAISSPLQAAGFDVVASDIADYGGEAITPGVDYLTAPLPSGVEGVVTNNRPGGPKPNFTIDTGRFTVRRARLAPAMISTPGHRASRRRQRGALPAWSLFGSSRLVPGE